MNRKTSPGLSAIPSEGGGIHQPFGYIKTDPVSYGILKEVRDEMKRKPTIAEERLWKLLKNNQVGHKIRRQHIINRFIVDFVCLSKKIIIEVDGDIHVDQQERDRERTQILESLGYCVLRFTNDEVIHNSSNVISIIKNYLLK